MSGERRASLPRACKRLPPPRQEDDGGDTRDVGRKRTNRQANPSTPDISSEHLQATGVEGDPESDLGRDQRRQSSSRECKSLVGRKRRALTSRAEAPDLGDQVWRNVPADLQDVILSYFPVHTFFDTVMAVNRPRWKEILDSPAFPRQLLGHGKNVSSSYGFLLALSKPCRKKSCPAKTSAITLFGFEHETGKWNTMPRCPFPMQSQLRVVTGSGGLLLLTTEGRWSDERLIIDLWIWNPLLRSRRMLPQNFRSAFRASYMLHVDAATKTYKVMELYSTSWKILNSYSVYDSASKSWTEVKEVGPNSITDTGLLQLYRDVRNKVSCEEYMCFVGRTDGSLHRQRGLVFYNTKKDSWHDLVFDEGLLPNGHVKQLVLECSLVALSGTLYIVMTAWDGVVHLGIRENDFKSYICSLNLCDFGSGARVQFITRVPYVSHELNCGKTWYSCVIGGRSFLCRTTSFQTPTSLYPAWLKYDISADTWSRSLPKRWPHEGHECMKFVSDFKPSLDTPA